MPWLIAQVIFGELDRIAGADPSVLLLAADGVEQHVERRLAVQRCSSG